jgi:hypothetical protein
MAYEDEVKALREENARLTAELAATKAQWERELIVAKARLLTVEAELDAAKNQLREALLRSITAEDEVFQAREEANKTARNHYLEV